MEFAPADPTEIDAVAEFLRSAFRAPAGAPFVQLDLLRWKYFEPRPDWSGPRSYVLKQDGRLVAHGCLYPVRLGGVQAARVIDWAASPRAPGAGVLLMRKLAAIAGVVLAPGGSRETREVLPKIGFKPRGRLSVYAKVVRPWLQFRSYPAKNWKSPLRLARNMWWSLGRTAAADGWQAEPAAEIDERIDYLLRCPAARFSAYRLSGGGYFVLSRVNRQARICELRIPGDDLRIAYAVAAGTAEADPQICELMTVASADGARQAILANGFRWRGDQPIFLYDPQGRLAGAPPLSLSLTDGDEAFLSNPADPFVT